MCMTIVNVKDYGATGNGSTNDAPGINAAIAAARKTGEYGNGVQGAEVYFPPGVYKINESINCTGGQFNLRGAGPYQSVIRGNTGQYAMVDFTIASFSSIRNMLLDTVGMPETTASKIGILVARNNTPGSYSSNVNLHNVVVRMGSSATANGGYGTVALYNFAGEEAAYSDTVLRGDTGLYLGSGNLFGVTSAYQTILAGEQSMTVVRMEGASSLLGIRGPALRLAGGAQVEIHAFIASHAGGWEFPTVTAPPYAVESASMWTGLTYTGSIEGPWTFLRQTGHAFRGLRAAVYISLGTGTSTAPGHLIKLENNAQLLDSDVAWVALPLNASQVQEPWMVLGSGTATHVISSRFTCATSKGIKGTGEAKGNALMANKLAANILVDFPTKSANLVHGLDSIVTI
jgi:hypothetical protein